MTSHPNRGTWRSAVTEPSIADIRAVVEGLTQREIALLANASLRTVEDWLSGARRPDSARWELLLLRLNRHPTHRLFLKAPRAE